MATLNLDTLAAAAQHLHEHGWAVVPDVLSEQQAQGIMDSIWGTLEAVSRGRVRRAEPMTWRGEAFFANMKGILMEPSDIYHCEGVWQVRQAVKPYFAHLYGDADLAASFDRLNIFPAPRDMGGKVKKIGPWLHTDQSSRRVGRWCVQGLVDFLGTGEHDAGLIVADKSHLAHHDLLYNQWGVASTDNWYRFTDEQRAYIEKHFPLIKVHCPPRAMCLWDSRTFHQNTPPAALGHSRLVVYVCMEPWAHIIDPVARERAKGKKYKAFINRRGTSHWPLTTHLFPKHARTYGKPLQDYNTDTAVIRPPPEHEVAGLIGLPDPLASATIIPRALLVNDATTVMRFIATPKRKAATVAAGEARTGKKKRTGVTEQREDAQ